MIPKIVAKGKSFKGAAAYLLHDKDHADTNERVEWTETRNLMTDDPDKAWRIMAATAMDQDRLKEEAGVKATGRKSDQSALHMVLSWHPDESADLDRDEMRRAAYGALKAIGADDRQAMIIAHNDEEHTHLHVLLNRVSPEDGRMLTSSKDRLKLSKWAEEYERDRGNILCHNRVANNERRDLGEMVVDKNAKPHNLAKADDLTRSAANDNSQSLEALKSAQKARDRALMRKGAELAETHKNAWGVLTDGHKQRLEAIKAETQKAISKARTDIGQTYHPRRVELSAKIEADRQKFEEREDRIFGRLSNAMENFKYRNAEDGESRRSVLGDAFQFLSSAGARREALDTRHDQLKADMNRRQMLDLKSAHRTVQDVASEKRDQALKEYEALRGKLLEQQKAEQEQLKKEWQERRSDREAAIQAFQAGQERQGQAKAEFERVNPLPRSQQDDGQNGGGYDPGVIEKLGKEYDQRQNDQSQEKYRNKDDDFER